jgi:hypothetical protein
MEAIKKILEKNRHFLKRGIQKVYIDLKRKTTIPTEPKPPYYLECVKICGKLLENKETILLIAPISSKRYMKNEKYGIYVIFHGKSIEVINHVYNYTVQVDEKTWDLLIREFDCELEERRIQFEGEINKNIKYSLKNILKTIESKDETGKGN